MPFRSPTAWISAISILILRTGSWVRAVVRSGSTTVFAVSPRAGSRSVIVHAGGQSRRLPAYATVGKSLAPLPVLRWAVGEKIDQSLLDLQLPLLRQIMDGAAEWQSTLVVSGDVLVRAGGNSLRFRKPMSFATVCGPRPNRPSTTGFSSFPATISQERRSILCSRNPTWTNCRSEPVALLSDGCRIVAVERQSYGGSAPAVDRCRRQLPLL